MFKKKKHPFTSEAADEAQRAMLVPPPDVIVPDPPTQRDVASKAADHAGNDGAYDPCEVCGSDRGSLASGEPCPVDGHRREDE